MGKGCSLGKDWETPGGREEQHARQRAHMQTPLNESAFVRAYQDLGARFFFLFFLLPFLHGSRGVPSSTHACCVGYLADSQGGSLNFEGHGHRAARHATTCAADTGHTEQEGARHEKPVLLIPPATPNPGFETSVSSQSGRDGPRSWLPSWHLGLASREGSLEGGRAAGGCGVDQRECWF